MHGGAGSECGGDARANFDRLYGLQGHDGGGEHGVEALVPLGVGAEAGRNLVGDDFKDAAEGVAGLEDFVDFFFHALLGFGVGAVQQDFPATVKRANLFPIDVTGNGNSAGGDYVAENFDAEFA